MSNATPTERGWYWAKPLPRTCWISPMIVRVDIPGEGETTLMAFVAGRASCVSLDHFTDWKAVNSYDPERERLFSELVSACKASLAAFDRGDREARPLAENWADLRAAAETARAVLARVAKMMTEAGR